MDTNASHFEVRATGNFGSFVWELPEPVRMQFSALLGRLSEESAEETLSTLRDDARQTIELLLLLISTAFLTGGSNSYETMKLVQKKLGEALCEAKQLKVNGS